MYLKRFLIPKIYTSESLKYLNFFLFYLSLTLKVTYLRHVGSYHCCINYARRLFMIDDKPTFSSNIALPWYNFEYFLRNQYFLSNAQLLCSFEYTDKNYYSTFKDIISSYVYEVS